MKGKFIVLEGIDSCGKDTQQDLLEKYFQLPRPAVTPSKEGEKYGEFVFVQVLNEKVDRQNRLRNIIFNPDFRFENKAEIFLFYADKVEMMKQIKEAIDAGKNVICNRWELSQYAYQIYGKEKSEFLDLTNYLTEDLQTFSTPLNPPSKEVGKTIYKPDLYILFDISPEESQKRKFARTQTEGKFEDYYDNAKKDFMERVILGYKTEIKKFNHVIINGEQSREKVFEDTLKEIENLLGQ